ncbi:MAG: helix-turn-helix domain-containing protein [Mesorhizobium sp.]|nr:helix-turn-helix domain-containing protein [Mesorhizobium sp.]
MSLMTPREAADLLSVSTKHLRKLTNAGVIRHVIVGNGTQRERRRYSAEDLQAFIDARSRQADPSNRPPGGPATKASHIIGIDFQALRAARENAKRRE